MEHFDKTDGNVSDVCWIAQDISEQELLLFFGEDVLLFRHHLIIVVLLALDLLQTLFVDPGQEHVLIRVEVRPRHEQVPEVLDVGDSD